MEKGFRKLIIWQRGHSFVLIIYKLTAAFPRDELYALTSQLRRAAISVVANIVEGNSRHSKKDYIRFIVISIGSLSEVEYYLLLAHDLGYISDTQYEQLEQKQKELARLLYGLLKSQQE